jgi:MFS family permease
MSSGATPAPRPHVPGLRLKLALMMFLQFFIWGAWFELGFDLIPKLGFNKEVTLPAFLGGWKFNWQLWMIFGAFNVGALVALFFSTHFADRHFAAEKFLAFSHLVGGLAILGLFFLPLKTGTAPGEYTSARIEAPGPTLTSGLGVLPDKSLALVENVVSANDDDAPEKMATPEAREKLRAYVAASPEDRQQQKLGEGLGSATKFWAVLKKDWAEYDAASPEERAEKKLKDPRPNVTFVVTKHEGNTIIGDAKAPLAPFWPFFGLMLLHSIFYVPTISITNSIAFANLRDPAQEFGPVRVWGTIGWIVASWPFIFILVNWAAVPAYGSVGFIDWLGKALGTSLEGPAALARKNYIFLVAGTASLVLALFSLALPHTPPKPAETGADALAWLKALRLLRHPFVAVLFLVTFIDAAVHQSFFFWTPTFLGPKADGGVVDIPANWVLPVMKIGQVSEIFTMLFLGYVLKRLGWRLTMTLGVLGHAARFAVFAYFPEQVPAILVNVLHGICYAFFFATVYIFVDEYFPKDVRSSAQGLFNVLILGLGPLAANFGCEVLKANYTVDGRVQYSSVFVYSMGAGLAGAAILFLFFWPRKAVEEPTFSETEKDAPPAP